MDELRFEVTGTQLRTMLFGTRILVIVAVLATVLWVPLAVLKGPRALLLAWAPAGIWIGALICLYAYLAYARAYAVCTLAGIRTRGLAGLRESSWAAVTEISLRADGIVTVRTAGGRRFWLGAPIHSAVVRDPELLAKFMQILSYWRSVTATSVSMRLPDGGAHPDSVRRDPRHAQR